MFIAIYTTVAPRKSPSRKGFLTVLDAEKYILSKICSECKEKYQDYLDGKCTSKEQEMNWSWPVCACEWEIFSSGELSQEDLDGIENYVNG